MALFSSKKNTEEKKAEKKPASASSAASGATIRGNVAVLKRARITEKASMHQGAGVYTFDVETRATKRDIIAAMRALYKVTPLKVAIVTVRAKARRSARNGKVGVSAGGKKAYVYLKKGETITLS